MTMERELDRLARQANRREKRAVNRIRWEREKSAPAWALFMAFFTIGLCAVVAAFVAFLICFLIIRAI